MKTVTITLMDKQYEKYAERAKASGKTLEQYLSDRINGVPFGYTVADDGLALHQPEADRIKAFVDEHTYEAVREKLENEGIIKKDGGLG